MFEIRRINWPIWPSEGRPNLMTNAPGGAADLTAFASQGATRRSRDIHARGSFSIFSVFSVFSVFYKLFLRDLNF